MHCPQCSAPINDSQAAFCAKCGTHLPVPIPVSRPISSEATMLTSHGAPPTPRAGVRARDVPVSQRRRLLKIILSAVTGAVLLAWVMGVTLYLAALPSVVMFAVDNEIAVKVQGHTGSYSDILNQTLNQIFVATWVWAFIGLAIGAGARWFLTRHQEA